MISAGSMPTLAAKAAPPSSLTQIAGVTSQVGIAAPKPRCASCQD
jgi:hypothetical protein